MRIKKTLKILAIAFGIVLVLLLLFFTAFVWNPTEGSLPDMRDVVPRNVDFFLRKTDLREDFGEFPEPGFWEEFSQSEEWVGGGGGARGLANGPLVADINKGRAVEKAVEQLREVGLRIEKESSGMLTLLGDLVGTEIIVAGRFVPPNFERTKFLALTRVSWKVRVIWGLLGFGSVRSNVPGLTAEDDGTFSMALGGGEVIHLARRLDCLIISNDTTLLTGATDLADNGGDAFGASASYRDGIQSRLLDWSETFPDESVRAVELYTRPDELFNLTRWDDGWPNERAEDDMNQRVLASFLNLNSWRFITSSLLFRDRAVSLLSKIELNRNEHSGFQSEFFRAESRPYKEWLTPFLALVPEKVGRQGNRGACAAAAMRMDAANFLLEMYEALEDRSLLDDPLRKTGKYDGARDLIDELRTVLLPRIGFVFMRAQDLGVEVFEPTPAPHFAWVFWIRPEMRAVIEDVRQFLTDYRDSIGFTSVTDLELGLAGDKCREFQSPHIPGTGEIAMLIYRDFFVLSNSSLLVRDMVQAKLGTSTRSVLQTDDWGRFQAELPSHVNAFVYLNGQRLSNVFQDYVRSFGSGMSDTPDASWMLANRKRIEAEVFSKSYRRYGSAARIPGSEQPAFDEAVDKALDAAWLASRSKFTAKDRDFYNDLRLAAKSFQSGYMQLELDPQFIQLTSTLWQKEEF